MSPLATNPSWSSAIRREFKPVAFPKNARRVLAIAVAALSFGTLAATTESSSVGDLALKRAYAMAEIYNWHAAAPLYAEAERLFTVRRDTRKALLAHIGYVRATFEERSFSETSRYFSNLCDEPLSANDPEVQFKCLIAKGDTDAEIDSAPAEADWRRVLALPGVFITRNRKYALPERSASRDMFRAIIQQRRRTPG